MFQDLESQSDNARCIAQADAKPSRPRVLLAVRPEDLKLAQIVVGDIFDVVWCHTFKEALESLDASIQVVACGVHFDNGRVFDLLRHVRENSVTSKLPVFILLGAGSRYSPAIVHGIRSAAELLGVTAFSDLTGMAEKFGLDKIPSILREGMLDAIVKDS